MRIKKNSLYLLFLVLAMSGMVFWLIGNRIIDHKEKETEAAVTELEIWYPWTDKYELYEKAFLEAVSEYNQGHKEIQLIPYGMEMELYRKKLPADIASNDMPDIYYCFSGSYMEEIVHSGRILKLDDYLKTISDEDGREVLEEVLAEPQNILSELLFDDQIYGLGFVNTSGVFLVNEELFNRYHLEVPKTTEQLITVCQEFMNYGITPLACSEDNDVGFRMYLEALCMGEVGAEDCISVMEGTEKENAAFLEGIGFFLKLLDMGAFGEVPVQKNTHEVEEAFLLSRIPMYYTKSSFIGNVMQKNNPLYGKIRAAAFPGTEGYVLMSGLCDGFVVNAATEYPQESTEALWEITQSLSEKLHESGAGISIWQTSEVIPDAILQDAEGNRVYLDMLQLMQTAKEYMPFLENVIDREQMKRYQETSRKLFEREISAEEFIQQITVK